MGSIIPRDGMGHHNMKQNLLFGLMALAFAVGTARSDLVLSALNTAVVIDFESTLDQVNNGPFAAAGFQSTPAVGQLDSDAWAVTGWSDGSLAFGGTQTAGDYARGLDNSGAVTTGGFYSFTNATLTRTLGIQPGGSDWAPGTLTLRMTNQTGVTITQLDIAYEVWVNNDQARSSSFNFSHSSDNSTYTSVSELDLTSTVAADALGFQLNNRSTSLTGLSIAPGEQYYIRWSGADVGGTGSRDEFALDDISITAVPEPTTFALLGIAAAVLISRRRA